MKQNEEMKISDFGRLIGFAPSAIRLYEKEGLLSPRRDSDSGYRSYRASDSFLLVNAKTLRSMGFPLRKTVSMLNGEDTGCESGDWETQEHLLDNELQRILAQREAVRYFREVTAKSDGLTRSGEIAERKAFYFVELGGWANFLPPKGYEHVVSEWSDYMPESGYWGTADVGTLKSGSLSLKSGFSILKSCMEREHIHVPKEAAQFEACTCLRTVLTMEYCEKPGDVFEFERGQCERVLADAQALGVELYGTGMWHFLQNEKKSEKLISKFLFYFPCRKILY